MIFKKSTLFFVLCIIIYLFSCKPAKENEIIFSVLNSPYHITEDIVIDSTMRMVVLPGTQFVFHDSSEIQIFGSIHMEGTKEKPIILQPFEKDSLWGGIKLFNPKDSCIFDNVIIINGLIWGRKADVKIQDYYFYNTYPLQKFDAIIRLIQGSAQVRSSYFESNQTGEGIILHNQEHQLVLVEDCEFYGVCDAVEYMRSFNNGFIRRNRILDVTTYLGDAIDLNGCSGVVIESNYFEKIEDCGIEIGNDNYGPSENIYSGNNTFVNCNMGIGLKGGSDVLIMNNTFYKDSIGICCMYNDFISNLDPNRVKIVNSIFASSIKRDLMINENSIVAIEYSLSDQQLFPGKSNLFSTPKFVNAEKRDFSLKNNSPGVGAARLMSHKKKYKNLKNLGALHVKQK